MNLIITLVSVSILISFFLWLGLLIVPNQRVEFTCSALLLLFVVFVTYNLVEHFDLIWGHMGSFHPNRHTPSPENLPREHLLDWVIGSLISTSLLIAGTLGIKYLVKYLVKESSQ